MYRSPAAHSILTEIGACCEFGSACSFSVWAPLADRITLILLDPPVRTLPMRRDARGFWHVRIEDVTAGARYALRVNDGPPRPDPASHFQPDGIHQPSQVVDHARFAWTDAAWAGIALRDMIIYELHTGTFTPDGTFDAIIPRLPALRELGINTLELMPVAQFPGARNWGYDGVHPFAVQNTYGGPDALKRLVNACHAQGIAVVLDVVYNHFGPEGNYAGEFAPYFTSTYRTPWGHAVNFDSAHSDGVRNFFIQNALHWFRNFHMDGLRLDAVHAIFDASARPFLRELAEEVEAYNTTNGRKHWLIAESDLNDVRLIQPYASGGCNLDAQWSDDFHHGVHTLLTGERSGYYEDFSGVEPLVKCLREGFAYSGQYSPYRKRRHGNSPANCRAEQFIVCIQNHDQVGNRMLGERLATLVSFEAQKLAAAACLLAPFVPLLFMGEEYGEVAPFLYFIDHLDPALVDAVRKGRRDEFRQFSWAADPPDPGSRDTFDRSRLQWARREQGSHRVMLNYYRELIRLRRTIPALANLDKSSLRVEHPAGMQLVILHRLDEIEPAILLLNFCAADATLNLPLADRSYQTRLESSARVWKGPGQLLPAQLSGDATITLRGHSAALLTALKV